MVPHLTRLAPAVTPWKKMLVRRWGRYPGYVIITGETCTAIWQDQKRVHLWNTSKCSLPFSPGERDTTTWRCHFLSAKVLIKNHKKGIAKRLQFLVKTIEQLIHPNNLSNAAQWSEQISSHVTTFIQLLLCSWTQPFLCNKQKLRKFNYLIQPI